ncbi:hypothetical protein HOP50_11g62620 [Chloropicon primus]|uniref:Uncharacterized protein n=2 Tax=Chloropicon primus TaxID=1764295 RepID=A0A5B8MW24_9CHLO|nr:hypothetical protein A3770_11p62400 [Chloropicon primus]UPR02935.1 hypothetical protein HOP50_11g62620 [Chloropicon primus]|eukprot:QDZ23722.1 hypothetical protein A3770_11p62400 [Chloropicon primus]
MTADEVAVLWEGTVASPGWQKHIVDLTDFQGEEIELSVAVSARSNANYDWFVLAEPELLFGFEKVASLVDSRVELQKRTVLLAGEEETSSSSGEVHGSRAYTGEFQSGGEAKRGVYIHPPFKNDVKGRMDVSFKFRVQHEQGNGVDHEL